jgi:hypothetical protein
MLVHLSVKQQPQDITRLLTAHFDAHYPEKLGMTHERHFFLLTFLLISSLSRQSLDLEISYDSIGA